MAITVTASPQSGVTTLENCCPVCETPVLPNDVFEGATHIPFVLNMTDGTAVTESTIGGSGVVHNGTGVIELAEAAEEGQILQVQVDDVNCRATACLVTVKARPDLDCEAPLERPCNIRVVESNFEVIADIYGKLTSLTVESNGALRYRLDNGEWKDSWTDIGVFSLSTSHVLGIKSKDNPNCRISHTLTVVQKIITIDTPVAVPTLVPTTPSSPTPTPVTTPTTPTPLTPSTPTAEVYRLLRCDGTGIVQYMNKTIEGLVGSVVSATDGQCYTVTSVVTNVATHGLGNGYVSCAACLGVPPPSTPAYVYWVVQRCSDGTQFKTLTSAATFNERFQDGGGTLYVSLGSNYITTQSDIGALTATGFTGCP